MPSPNPSSPVIDDNAKTIAIISYLSLIGWIIALVMYQNKKSSLAAFHLRQTIALYAVSMGFWVIEMVILGTGFLGALIAGLAAILYLGLFILWIIGFIAAINGQEKPIPLIGDKAQVWFKGIA
ncbi:MAG: hypothetical protein KGM98_09155 [Bacteroidota bacterium]|nr:hypothetical protein [Bacteroidota bacterium]